MARIDYAISVTPIQASQYDVTYDSAEAGTSTTNTDIDYVYVEGYLFSKKAPATD